MAMCLAVSIDFFDSWCCCWVGASDSELQCISDRKSAKLIVWSAGKPSFSYTSSASLVATVVCKPTRAKIASSSERLRCVTDAARFWHGDLVALQSSVIDTAFALAKLFHSWNRLVERFSKSMLPTQCPIRWEHDRGREWRRERKM